MIVVVCSVCRQAQAKGIAYAELFLVRRQEDRVTLCSRHCLRAWLAAHPDKEDEQGAPE